MEKNIPSTNSVGGKKMNRKIIIHIHDDTLRIGDAIKMLDKIDYNNAGYFNRYCAWRFDGGSCVEVDIAKNKGSIRFDIWNGRRKNEP